MISSLSGLLRVKQPTAVVLDVSGIGFELTVPLSSSRVLGDVGTNAHLEVQTVFTRDGLLLFGFASRDEKDIFNRLTSVKGIGPKAALNLLSRFTPAEISSILGERKVETLKTVPGIGPKKADMLLGRVPEPGHAASPAEPHDEQAVTALTALGLTRAESLKRLERIADRASLPLSEVLTLALRQKE